MSADDSKSSRLRRGATGIVRALRHAGFEAFWVGGCVRDFLLRRRPSDYDIVTSALPRQVVPHLGIAGGAVAVLIYYVIGCAVFAVYLWSGRGVLKPSLLPPRLRWSALKDILRVGVASSAISLSTNVTAVVATGLAGLVGPAAVAGYGTGVRLEDAQPQSARRSSTVRTPQSSSTRSIWCVAVQWREISRTILQTSTFAPPHH